MIIAKYKKYLIKIVLSTPWRFHGFVCSPRNVIIARTCGLCPARGQSRGSSAATSLLSEELKGERTSPPLAAAIIVWRGCTTRGRGEGAIAPLSVLAKGLCG